MGKKRYLFDESSSRLQLEFNKRKPRDRRILKTRSKIESKKSTIEEHHVAQGLSIVGYFHANERFDDVELCGVAKNIGDLISRYFPQAPILLVIKCLIFYCYLL
ncbi:uncharacterized protein LOC9307605 [Arabidopsis lyrata subsp. lyrata]|uniref:uncharacterized protein LOC9307605 n=1 Tax=Arabidopsis lyrata subsp. lyrata TaxID=81972 RepID=UPI000A29CEF5|nr:uncharacterized protein LOC9307605 [Arabidopsis lyrata subsp. lyrata]|eukprot:XP_020879496.1 uncharacterized protein LOC9307605 [Arabidopsis lyrata subsp. lyrata]